MKKIFLAYAITSIHMCMAAENPSCTPIDLRDSTFAPIRSQMFVDTQGKVRDSQMCHAFSAANLIGQALHKAVSPEDITFIELNADPFNEGLAQDPALDGITDGSGFVNSDIKYVQIRGACSEALLDRKLASAKTTTIQALYNFVQTQKTSFSSADMLHYLDNLCETRIPIPSLHLTVLTVDREKPDIFHALAIDAIDKALSQGKMVTFNESGHYRTLVGKLSNCDYIVQDSIPKSYWMTSSTFLDVLNNLKRAGGSISFQSENISTWNAEAIKFQLDEVDYLSQDSRSLKK